MKVFKIKVKRANTIQNEVPIESCGGSANMLPKDYTTSVCISVLFCLMSTAALMNDPCS